MRSPTQPHLTETDVAALVHRGLGATVVAAEELTGGGFATVWRATIQPPAKHPRAQQPGAEQPGAEQPGAERPGGKQPGAERHVVVKVGPAPGTPLLGYERGLVAAEGDYFRLVRQHAPDLPVPDVLAEGDNWLITSFLPGRTLEDHDDPAVRVQLGEAVARIHGITGERFGYPGDRPSGATWPEAFAAMLDGLRADAGHWGVPLPGLDGLADRHAASLARVTRPALVHYDLWDGNVLGVDGRLTGLVDGERYLFGDPLVDLVSTALWRRIEEEPDHPFLRGYGSPALDDDALVRLALYRVHLHVLMLAEGPSRGIPVGGDRHGKLTAMLEDELTRLR